MKRGFTLIEAIIAITVFIIVSGAVFSFVTALYRAQEMLFVQADVLEEARRGMSEIVREIRQARSGEDGSYMITRADNYEIIFHSDLTGDGVAERVRYHINPAGGRVASTTQSCVSFQAGGSCQVLFSGFLQNRLKNARLSVSVRGDLEHSTREYANILVGTNLLGRLCRGSGVCGQCANEHQDLRSFDVTNLAANNSLLVTVSASSHHVEPICRGTGPNHSIRALLTLSWEEEPLPRHSDLFMKEVSTIGGWPPLYGNPRTTVVSGSIRNAVRGEPVFLYYDRNGLLINNPGTRIREIRMVRISMTLNPDPGRPPDDFSLVSMVHLRNHRPQ